MVAERESSSRPYKTQRNTIKEGTAILKKRKKKWYSMIIA